MSLAFSPSLPPTAAHSPVAPRLAPRAGGAVHPGAPAHRTEAPARRAPSSPRLSAVPEGTEARGFALFVGLDAEAAAAAGTSLSEVVTQLRALAAQLVPGIDTHAAVALAPVGAGGRDLDVVRLALQDPAALARHRDAVEPEALDSTGVVVDISRKRVLIDEQPVNLTYKEFELLQFLVLREGRTVERQELIDGIWSAGDEEEIPAARTVDVHVRRLRSKLGAFEGIVRTVRGAGYRFDRHADVTIRYASTPSPDLF